MHHAPSALPGARRQVAVAIVQTDYVISIDHDQNAFKT